MTLREIHERCKTRHAEIEHPAGSYCGWCSGYAHAVDWPCPDYRDAVAALEILDESDVMGTGTIFTGLEHVTHRVVPDPEAAI